MNASELAVCNIITNSRLMWAVCLFVFLFLNASWYACGYTSVHETNKDGRSFAASGDALVGPALRTTLLYRAKFADSDNFASHTVFATAQWTGAWPTKRNKCTRSLNYSCVHACSCFCGCRGKARLWPWKRPHFSGLRRGKRSYLSHLFWNFVSDFSRQSYFAIIKN